MGHQLGLTNLGDTGLAGLAENVQNIHGLALRVVIARATTTNPLFDSRNIIRLCEAGEPVPSLLLLLVRPVGLDLPGEAG